MITLKEKSLKESTAWKDVYPLMLKFINPRQTEFLEFSGASEVGGGVANFQIKSIEDIKVSPREIYIVYKAASPDKNFQTGFISFSPLGVSIGKNSKCFTQYSISDMSVDDFILDTRINPKGTFSGGFIKFSFPRETDIIDENKEGAVFIHRFQLKVGKIPV